MQYLQNLLTNLLSFYKGISKGRKLFFLVIIPLVMFSLYGTDPDIGLFGKLNIGTNLTNTLLILIPVFLYYAVLHIGRKILHDYVNLGDVYKKAMETPQGAGLVFVAVAIITLALAVVILAATSGYVKLPV